MYFCFCLVSCEEYNAVPLNGSQIQPNGNCSATIITSNPGNCLFGNILKKQPQHICMLKMKLLCIDSAEKAGKLHKALGSS